MVNRPEQVPEGLLANLRVRRRQATDVLRHFGGRSISVRVLVPRDRVEPFDFQQERRLSKCVRELGFVAFDAIPPRIRKRCQCVLTDNKLTGITGLRARDRLNILRCRFELGKAQEASPVTLLISICEGKLVRDLRVARRVDARLFAAPAGTVIVDEDGKKRHVLGSFAHATCHITIQFTRRGRSQGVVSREKRMRPRSECNTWFGRFVYSTLGFWAFAKASASSVPMACKALQNISLYSLEYLLMMTATAFWAGGPISPNAATARSQISSSSESSQTTRARISTASTALRPPRHATAANRVGSSRECRSVRNSAIC
jgi:hypothetical protein